MKISKDGKTHVWSGEVHPHTMSPDFPLIRRSVWPFVKTNVSLLLSVSSKAIATPKFTGSNSRPESAECKCNSCRRWPELTSRRRNVAPPGPESVASPVTKEVWWRNAETIIGRTIVVGLVPYHGVSILEKIPPRYTSIYIRCLLNYFVDDTYLQFHSLDVPLL